MSVLLLAFTGGFFGVVATFAGILLGFFLIFLGIYSVLIGGVVGLIFGAWKGFKERPTDKKESEVKTSDRPFY